MAAQAIRPDGCGRPCAAAQPTSTAPAGSSRTALTHSGAVRGASTCTPQPPSWYMCCCQGSVLGLGHGWDPHSNNLTTSRLWTCTSDFLFTGLAFQWTFKSNGASGQTFMATMEVPQKKKGDISRRRAASCCKGTEGSSSPAANGQQQSQHASILQVQRPCGRGS